jgi:hypothetical protein
MPSLLVLRLRLQTTSICFLATSLFIYSRIAVLTAAFMCALGIGHKHSLFLFLFNIRLFQLELPRSAFGVGEGSFI